MFKLQKGSELFNKLLDLKSKIVDSCPSCGGQGYAFEDDDYSKCDCMIRYLYLKDLVESRIPVEYWTLYFEDLQISDVYKKLTRVYFSNFSNACEKGLGFLFLGTNGVGKTSLMCEIGKYAITQLKKVFYLTNEQYISALQSQNTFFLDCVQEAEVLLLDEFEKAYMKEGSDYVPKKTEDLIRKSFSQGKIIIISSNQTEKNLEEIFGESTLSAIKRHLKLVNMSGSDHSPKLHDEWLTSLKTEFDFSHENILKYANIRNENLHEG